MELRRGEYLWRRVEETLALEKGLEEIEEPLGFMSYPLIVLRSILRDDDEERRIWWYGGGFMP